LITESDIELKISEEKLFENINKLLPILLKYKINDIDFRDKTFENINEIYCFLDSFFYYKNKILHIRTKDPYLLTIIESESGKKNEYIYRAVPFKNKCKRRDDLIAFINDYDELYIFKNDNILINITKLNSFAVKI